MAHRARCPSWRYCLRRLFCTVRSAGTGSRAPLCAADETASYGHARTFSFASILLPLPRARRILDQYDEDIARATPLIFFADRSAYRLLGLVPCRLHLFGTSGERVFLVGTDGFGRDQLSRILYGGQVSLLAGLVGAGITLLFGLGIGAAAGYYGGWRDEVLMRLSELFLALPWLYLLLGLRAFLPLAVSPLEAFLLIVIVIGLVGWARPARLIRGVVLSVKERDFVRAAAASALPMDTCYYGISCPKLRACC